MKLAVISFTERGSRLNRSVSELLSREGIEVESTALAKYAESAGLSPLTTSLHDWTEKMFESQDALLFIGATGIAVRSIAPFVADKRKDPAVVVMDEKGIFAISLLSGHIGGANELAGKLANLTGAIPVITTATDVNGRFAVDVFAKKQKLWIADMKAAKQVSADVLDEKKIGLVTDFPILGEMPEELELLKGTEPFEGKTGMCHCPERNVSSVSLYPSSDSEDCGLRARLPERKRGGCHRGGSPGSSFPEPPFHPQPDGSGQRRSQGGGTGDFGFLRKVRTGFSDLFCGGALRSGRRFYPLVLREKRGRGG